MVMEILRGDLLKNTCNIFRFLIYYHAGLGKKYYQTFDLTDRGKMAAQQARYLKIHSDNVNECSADTSKIGRKPKLGRVQFCNLNPQIYSGNNALYN